MSGNRHGGGRFGMQGRMPMGMSPMGQPQMLNPHMAQQMRSHPHGGMRGPSNYQNHPGSSYQGNYGRHNNSGGYHSRGHNAPRITPNNNNSSSNSNSNSNSINSSNTPSQQQSSTPQTPKQPDTPTTTTEEKLDIEVCSILPIAVSSCFHKTEPLLFTGDTDGAVHVYKVNNELSDTFLLLNGGMAVGDILSVGRWVFVARNDTIMGYDTADLTQAMDAVKKGKEELLVKEVLTVQPALSVVLPCKDVVAVTLAWCESMDELVVGDSSGQVWKYVIGENEGPALVLSSGPWALHRSNVVGIVFDDTRMITASQDCTVVFTGLKDEETMQLAPCVLQMETARAGVKRSSSGVAKSDTIVACAVNCIDVDSDNLWLAVGGDVPYVSIVCLTTNKVRKTILLPCSDWRVKSLKFLGASILVGVDDSCVLTYSLGGQLLSSRSSVSDTVHTISVSSDGKWAASGKNTNTEIF